jgi:hypothetical protein
VSFTAQYPGRCNAADDAILPGDRIAEDTDGGFSHTHCLDDEPDTRRARVCPRCHLEHAGECF